MIAKVTSDIRERIPLHASATSNAMDGKLITLPSRKIGTPSRGKTPAATLEASICKGNVIWFRTMVGIGIINRRKAHGKITARRADQPKNRTTIPPSNTRSDERARKSSAPIWPTTSKNTAKQSNAIPDQEGRGTRRENFDRSVQT